LGNGLEICRFNVLQIREKTGRYLISEGERKALVKIWKQLKKKEERERWVVGSGREGGGSNAVA
jgi:hypothetical protein